MFLVHLGVTVLLVVLGLVFFRGKGAFLIAGYNTASKEEKAKYDEKALCRFMGRLMFAMAGCWALVALGTLLDRLWIYYLGLGLFLTVIFGGVVYANTGRRFQKK